VYTDSYQDKKDWVPPSVVRPDGPKHTFTNHIAISTNNHTFKNQIFGIKTIGFYKKGLADYKSCSRFTKINKTISTKLRGLRLLLDLGFKVLIQLIHTNCLAKYNFRILGV
jgi:hypothetical protein